MRSFAEAYPQFPIVQVPLAQSENEFETCDEVKKKAVRKTQQPFLIILCLGNISFHHLIARFSFCIPEIFQVRPDAHKSL
jgi:hypothetical protein